MPGSQRVLLLEERSDSKSSASISRSQEHNTGFCWPENVQWGRSAGRHRGDAHSRVQWDTL